MSSCSSWHGSATPPSPPPRPRPRPRPPTRRPRQATIYDAVAGRISSTGFISLVPFTHKNRDTLASSSIPLPPEAILLRPLRRHRRRGGCTPDPLAAQTENDNKTQYWASRDIRADQKLPDSDLLKAVHAYASHFYARNGGRADFESLDGSALIALGILLEEWAGEVLSAGGEGVFVEGEEREGGKKGDGGEGGDEGRDRAWRFRRIAEKRKEDRKKEKRRRRKEEEEGEAKLAAKEQEQEHEGDEDDDENEAVASHTTETPTPQPKIKTTKKFQRPETNKSSPSFSDNESTTHPLLDDDRDATASTTTNFNSESESESDGDGDGDGDGDIHKTFLLDQAADSSSPSSSSFSSDRVANNDGDDNNDDSTKDSEQDSEHSPQLPPRRTFTSPGSYPASASASASGFSPLVSSEEDEDEDEDEEAMREQGHGHVRKRRRIR